MNDSSMQLQCEQQQQPQVQQLQQSLPPNHPGTPPELLEQQHQHTDVTSRDVGGRVCHQGRPIDKHERDHGPGMDGSHCGDGGSWLQHALAVPAAVSSKQGFGQTILDCPPCRLAEKFLYVAATAQLQQGLGNSSVGDAIKTEQLFMTAEPYVPLCKRSEVGSIDVWSSS